MYLPLRFLVPKLEMLRGFVDWSINNAVLAGHKINEWAILVGGVDKVKKKKNRKEVQL